MRLVHDYAKMTGICDVCGTASPLKTCGLCGARVCPRCMAGQICQMCARGRQIG